jgi:hypothetical protein
MNLYLIRYPNMGGTPGDLVISRKVFCHTLEGVIPPDGIKTPTETAIPSGTYPVVLSMSQRFGKVLPEVQNVPGFTGIRMHGGNTIADTEGCILCAYNIVAIDVIQGQAADDLVDLFRQFGEEITLTIVNT